MFSVHTCCLGSNLTYLDEGIVLVEIDMDRHDGCSRRRCKIHAHHSLVEKVGQRFLKKANTMMNAKNIHNKLVSSNPEN